jgi:hypothetical protein
MNIMSKKRLTPEERSDKDILTLALERYEDCQPVCEEVYRQAVDDIKFSVGQQWASNETNDRKDRPCLVENRCAGLVHQVTNEQRQQRPQITVRPRDESTDPDTAEIINGLLRFIQYDSDSETALDTASSNQVRGGIGWLQVCTEYEDEDNPFGGQAIKMRRIKDVRCVKAPFHLCNEIDLRDMPYCFIEAEMSKKDFEIEYPNVEVDNWKATSAKGWVTEDKVRIAEYYTIDKTPVQVYKLSDDSVTEEIPDESTGLTVVDTRTRYDRKVSWYKITNSQILEKGVIPGSWIPVIPIVGEEITIDNKTLYRSLIADAKDPQRMLNFWRSAEAERIALAPKAKWVMYAGQDEGFEQEWLDSHRSNNPILHANVRIEGGELLPLPRRESPNPIDTAIVEAGREAVDAIKATSGIFDASLGSESNEKSGRAILARQRQAGTGNFHFSDNFSKALKHCGRVIVDMIPEVIDTERSVQILGEDMKPLIQKVNQSYAADGKLYDLRAGKYDVVVTTGASYASKREEAAANISELGMKDPALIQSTRDLLLKYLDLPAEVVERARKTIPPELLDDGKGDSPELLKAQNAQLMQQMQQLDVVIQEMTKEAEANQAMLAGKQMDNTTRESIAQLQAQVQLIIAGMKTDIDKNKMAHEVGIESMRHSHNMQNGDVEASRNPASDKKASATGGER